MLYPTYEPSSCLFFSKYCSCQCSDRLSERTILVLKYSFENKKERRKRNRMNDKMGEAIETLNPAFTISILILLSSLSCRLQAHLLKSDTFFQHLFLNSFFSQGSKEVTGKRK